MSFSDEVWIHLDPDTILYLFLPPLIFESAASSDVHIWSRASPQILTMAIPGQTGGDLCLKQDIGHHRSRGPLD